jgi:hypothetical protein
MNTELTPPSWEDIAEELGTEVEARYPEEATYEEKRDAFISGAIWMYKTIYGDTC